MNTKNFTKALTFTIALLCILAPAAGQKVQGIPEAYVLPKDYFDNPEFVQKNLYDNSGSQSKSDAWIVFSDRNDNKVYDNRSESSTVLGTVNFRELYYVIDQDRDWIRIAKAVRVNKLKAESVEPVGWIKKDKLLLWSSGLVGEKTGIHRKAFLLNRAENIGKVIELLQKGKHLEAEFFADPQAQTALENRNIYDHYFIYKKENGMVLLAQEASLTPFNFETALLGWVDEGRIQKWNTRISLAPNFEEEAYNERKGNSWAQFRAFDSPQNATKYANEQAKEGVIWDNDPIIFQASQMASSDPRRFPGNTIRFPLFNKSDFGGTPYIRSGVIGGVRVGQNQDGSLEFNSSIPEHEYNQIKSKLGELSKKAENVNIFFVIEGTDETLPYKEAMVTAIESLAENEAVKSSLNVQYGALIYRDVPEGDRVIGFERLQSNLEKVTDFITNADFVNKVDQDPYTAMYYGLQEALKVAGFDESNTNIVVLLGSNGDFLADKDRKEMAREENSPFMIDKNKVVQNLSEMKTHLFSIQLSNAGRPGLAYSLQSHSFILESAKYQFNRSKQNADVQKMVEKNQDMQLEEPSMDMPKGKNKVVLKGSRPGQILLPSDGRSLSADNITVGLNEMVSSSIAFEQFIVKVFNSVYGVGEELDIRKFSEEGGISAPDLTSEVLRVYEEIFAQTGVSSDYVMQSTEVKLMLYTEVYLPVKAKSAKNPMSSYVLFMPETDLVNYQRLIDRNIMTAGSGTYDQKREALYEMYLALIGQFASQDFLKNKKPQDLSRKDVVELMQGIQGEGLDLQIELNVTIGDILSEKAVPNEQIDQLIQRFVATSELLQEKLKLRDRSDFCYKSDNENFYYWLKLEEVEF